MTAKIAELEYGQRVEVKCVLLANGNLVIPKRRADNRRIGEWVEVWPGTDDYKRWLPVAVDEPDPRRTQES